MRRFVLAFALFGLFVTGCGDDGNKQPQDAGVVDAPPDGPPTAEVTCETLTPLASGTCEVTTGNASQLIKGTVLTPTTIYHGGQVLVDGTGQISCVGCNCAAGGETTIVCPDGTVSPGLINTHDHITFTQNQPYTDTGERYEDRQQWRKGLDSHAKIPSAGSATADQIRWGELRFLMGGATSIIGSGGQPGLLRNLDQAANEEGLAKGAVNFDTFPLDDSSGTRQTTTCNYGAAAATAASIATDNAYEPHTSEGIDATAHNEFLCESSATYDVTAPGVSNDLLLAKTSMIHGIGLSEADPAHDVVVDKSAFIHALGLSPADYADMAANGTSLIWSPRSNITLYGDTARVSTAARLGINIALGTDWMPTGSMNLLRELACADSFNQTYLGKFFSDEALWQMVTSNAATASHTDDVIGLLASGHVADITIFNAHGKNGFRSVIEAQPADVVLVMRGGKVLYGDDTNVAALGVGCDALDVCGTMKRVCLMSEIGKTLPQLQTAVGTTIYPAFSCTSPPMNEPTCTPKRPTAVAGSTVYTGVPAAGDMDGDGVPDAMDNCPTVFNPIRPMDNGVQGDADGDGIGDACDVCPLDANTNMCTVVDPNDRDHDGIPNSSDNCPDVANPDQLDTDHDGKGDVCDACPMDANMGSAGCPSTIYKVKTGVSPVGSSVHIPGALVTGKGTNGFFVQVKETDAGYMGSDNSGLFVFTTDVAQLANATVGARVSLDGAISNFQGEIELGSTAVTVEMVGPESAPAPIAATYTEVATGGTRATTLEGVIVSLGASTITATNAMLGEFTVTSGTDTLIVDDFVFAFPNPAVDQNFLTVTGILSLRQMVSKLEPRAAGDLVLGAPGLKSLTPALSFAKVGATINAPTFPTPLTVNLTGPAQGATTVMLISSDGTKLTVANVTVPNGASSAVVPVTAVAQSADVTVTAMLGVQMQTAHVRVVGATELPTTVTLSPSDTAIAPNAAQIFTVTLDIPAPIGGTVVALSVNPANAGTLPANVTVAANQVSATFTYTDGGTATTATVTATLGGSTSNATVTISTGANHLVLNEVDYDQINTDNAEFIEIFNPSGAAISLVGKQVILINGSGNAIYDTIDLSPAVSLPSHGYLVIAGAGITVAPPALKIDPGWTTNAIQNGPPDGIALIDNTAHTLIDALDYEDSTTAPTMTAVDLPGFAAPVSLVEGTVLTASDSNTVSGSLCRSPDGQDTDNANADWKFCTTITVGAANQ
jgi:hypothetical protein